jgi:hypothetical protein
MGGAMVLKLNGTARVALSEDEEADADGTVVFIMTGKVVSAVKVAVTVVVLLVVVLTRVVVVSDDGEGLPEVQDEVGVEDDDNTGPSAIRACTATPRSRVSRWTAYLKEPGARTEPATLIDWVARTLVEFEVVKNGIVGVRVLAAKVKVLLRVKVWSVKPVPVPVPVPVPMTVAMVVPVMADESTTVTVVVVVLPVFKGTRSVAVLAPVMAVLATVTVVVMVVLPVVKGTRSVAVLAWMDVELKLKLSVPSGVR